MTVRQMKSDKWQEKEQGTEKDTIPQCNTLWPCVFMYGWGAVLLVSAPRTVTDRAQQGKIWAFNCKGSTHAGLQA